jgi:thiosulfate dehydrogenase
MNKEQQLIKAIVTISKHIIRLALIVVFCISIIVVFLFNKYTTVAPSLNTATSLSIENTKTATIEAVTVPQEPTDTWKAPDINAVPSGKTGDMIRYGKELVCNTSKYFGPEGVVAPIANGMNCQNCHLAGGSRLFANDYAGFTASYPRFSGRNGKIESAATRITECFERSLNGKAPDTSGKEIQSILAYMKWIGKDVKKGHKPYGSGTEKIAFTDHMADLVKGKTVFLMKCQSCHGSNGEGQLTSDKKSYLNPPLWGVHSYNDGAGMYRITNLAGFIKNNMPFGATYQNPQLTDEEAWHVAAFVNSQPRPHKDQRNDWKNLKMKPVDFPFGPYADKFKEHQHKYGPFGPIIAAHNHS